MRKFIIALWLVLFSVYGFGQHKYEKEVRIGEMDVPENALKFVETMNLNTSIRWYKEYSQNGISYEAKTRYRGERYSIEFSLDGVFEDMEIEISQEDIPGQVLSKIEGFFRTEYERYEMEKLQLQLSGDAEQIRQNFRDRGGLQGVSIHYEIVISTRLDGSFMLFEYLFTDSGGFVRKATIREKSTDNIIY